MSRYNPSVMADPRAALAETMTRLYCHTAMQRLEIAARNVLSAVCQGDMLAATLAGLRRTAKHQPVDTVALRRQVADAVIEQEAWPFRLW